ncbi:trpD [Gossypium arboreum]|uniref:TrpD n=1 Tax=Gossypium arboreum TaxID=29729 RepID=A0A0B0P8Q9_GOSAR|nr:trpD [Gossypium arboreum]
MNSDSTQRVRTFASISELGLNSTSSDIRIHKCSFPCFLEFQVSSGWRPSEILSPYRVNVIGVSKLK